MKTERVWKERLYWLFDGSHGQYFTLRAIISGSWFQYSVKVNLQLNLAWPGNLHLLLYCDAVTHMNCNIFVRFEYLLIGFHLQMIFQQYNKQKQYFMRADWSNLTFCCVLRHTKHEFPSKDNPLSTAIPSNSAVTLPNLTNLTKRTNDMFTVMDHRYKVFFKMILKPVTEM